MASSHHFAFSLSLPSPRSPRSPRSPSLPSPVSCTSTSEETEDSDSGDVHAAKGTEAAGLASQMQGEIQTPKTENRENAAGLNGTFCIVL